MTPQAVMAAAVKVKREDCTYTACYCEENVWKLCKTFEVKLNQECFAVFISNKEKKVPIWEQQASSSLHQPVVWDYHVIFLVSAESDNCIVYDLDTVLCFPEQFDSYVKQAFRTDIHLKDKYRQYFRVIPSSVFLQTFASDRSHMKTADGDWLSSPPNYPPITSPVSTNNIDQFISMEPDIGWGDILNLEQFVNRFSKNGVT